MYYIFKNVNEETGVATYGIVPEEKAANKEMMEQLAFQKLEELPEIPANSEGKEYFLHYDEGKKKFYFKV